jgi:acyl-[acyl carrier protein]--UDP-N-acetylglucosamine O-acyltransferase
VKPWQQELHGEVEPEAQVGIFWVVDDNVLLDTSPLSAAEEYLDMKVHSGEHKKVWGTFQRLGKVPRDIEYDEPPRGRVAYHKTTRKFSLLADKCILRDTNKITNIMSLMHLPSNTRIGSDSHYRCSRCLRQGAEPL